MNYDYVPGEYDAYDELEQGDAGDERVELGHAQFRVKLCSHEEITVLTEQEQRWLGATRDAYLEQNKFTEVTDLQDVDRLLVLELSIFRWTQYLASGFDYNRNLVNEEMLRKQIKDASDAINKLKVSLGLDKKAREAALSSGNFHTWFADATRRAKLFGLHRQEQLRTALVLMNDLSTIVGTFDRSDEEERRKVGYETEADIVAWVRDHMIPTYHQVDEHFRENEQKLWARDL